MVLPGVESARTHLRHVAGSSGPHLARSSSLKKKKKNRGSGNCSLSLLSWFGRARKQQGSMVTWGPVPLKKPFSKGPEEKVQAGEEQQERWWCSSWTQCRKKIFGSDQNLSEFWVNLRRSDRVFMLHKWYHVDPRLTAATVGPILQHEAPD